MNKQTEYQKETKKLIKNFLLLVGAHLADYNKITNKENFDYLYEVFMQQRGGIKQLEELRTIINKTIKLRKKELE
jgi:hypothetical protein